MKTQSFFGSGIKAQNHSKSTCPSSVISNLNIHTTIFIHFFAIGTFLGTSLLCVHLYVVYIYKNIFEREYLRVQRKMFIIYFPFEPF